MKFIVNIFDKDLINDFSTSMNGEIVNKHESLVIVDMDDELTLDDVIKTKFPNLEFRSQELK